MWYLKREPLETFHEFFKIRRAFEDELERDWPWPEYLQVAHRTYGRLSNCRVRARQGKCVHYINQNKMPRQTPQSGAVAFVSDTISQGQIITLYASRIQ